MFTFTHKHKRKHSTKTQKTFLPTSHYSCMKQNKSNRNKNKENKTRCVRLCRLNINVLHYAFPTYSYTYIIRVWFSTHTRDHSETRMQHIISINDRFKTLDWYLFSKYLLCAKYIIYFVFFFWLLVLLKHFIFNLGTIRCTAECVFVCASVRFFLIEVFYFINPREKPHGCRGFFSREHAFKLIESFWIKYFKSNGWIECIL